MINEEKDDVVDGVVDVPVNDEEPSEAFIKAFDEILADPELDQEEVTEDDDPQVDEPTDEPEDQAEELPEAWVAAGHEAGLSDDEIESLANSTPKVLEALVSKQRKQEPEPQPQPPVEEKVTQPIARIEFDLPEGTDENTRKVLEAMAANQNSLIDRFNETQTKLGRFEDMSHQQELAAIAAHDRQVDDFFDSQVEVCPAVGKNDDLNERQLAARQEIYGLSERIQGKTLQERLEKAVRAYNGIHGVAEKELAKKLYKQKQRFSPRPQSRKTKQQFQDADARAMHMLEEKARELGVDLS